MPAISMHTKLVSSAIIGSFPERGFVEALVTLQSKPSLRVCVKVPDFQRIEEHLAAADALLSTLLEELHAVEHLANSKYPEHAPTHVWGVWLNADGTASYTCGSDDADAEEFITVVRDGSGSLRVQT